MAAVALLVSVAMPAFAADDANACDHYIASLPTEIKSPGTWCLASDLVSDPAATDNFWGVWIRSDDVTIDCRGHLMDGTGVRPPGRSGILSMNDDGQDRSVVRNCRLHGYTEGISIDGDDNRVENSIITDSLISGIVFWGDRGLIRENHILETGDKGIEAHGNVDILDNVIRGFVTYPYAYALNGIALHQATSGTIEGNRILLAQSGIEPDRVGIGIQLGSSRDVVVRDNVIIGQGVGIDIGCYHTVDVGNHLIGNVGTGVQSSPGSRCGLAINNRFHP